MNPLTTVRQRMDALSRGATTAAAMSAAALDAAADVAGEGRRTFVRLLADLARMAAEGSDARRRAGAVRSPIDGLPVSVKDLFDIAGQTTLAGSIVLRDAPPAARDADVVARLNAAGAVIVGRTNMTEFAYSGLGINPHYGTPSNAWDRAAVRIPGGSSSGAVVAVTDGMCAASIGSDTGGSIRIPAALCGVVGFKPTARSIPRGGMLPLSTTLDSVGVIAPTVDCCAMLYRALADHADDTLADGIAQDAAPVAGRRFLVPSNLVLDGLDADVARSFDGALRRLSGAGAAIAQEALAELGELANLNAAGGFSAAEAYAWHRDLVAARGGEYDPRVLSRILRGRAISARDVADLAGARRAWIDRVAKRLQAFDAMLMPTVPTIAPRLAPLVADEALYVQANAAMLRNPSIVNFLDGCAISLPCHVAGEAPVGISVVRQGGDDAQLIALARSIEPLVRASS
ncbi:MAG TPA: amidase [Burkholderiaceae bacterium]|nr:amidase [Burkholderiaceae bacterium]